jgi:AcrR family transcriptional regulator
MPAGRPKAFLGRERKILDAALHLFATRGVTETTVADVARAGDMGVGAVYRYFGNRQELFRRVVRHAAARVGEIVMDEAATASVTLGDYEQQLFRIGERLAALVDSEPQLVRFLLEDARGFDDEVDRQLDGMVDLFAGFTEGYLAHGKKRGYLRYDLDVAVTARLVNAMIFEAVRQLGPRSKIRDRHKWMYALVRLMLNGVSGR